MKETRKAKLKLKRTLTHAEKMNTKATKLGQEMLEPTLNEFIRLWKENTNPEIGLMPLWNFAVHLVAERSLAPIVED